MFSTPSKQDFLQLALIVVGHLLLTIWSLNLMVSPENISLMWMPDGYLLACLVLLPSRLWFWLIIILTVSLFSFESTFTDRPEGMIFSFIFANMLESVGGALLFRYFSHGERIFKDFRQLSLFLFFCVLVLPSISSVVGASTVVHYGFSNDFWSVYRTWLVSAGLGILCLTPLIMHAVEFYRSDTTFSYPL